MDTLVSITIYGLEEPGNWRRHITAAFEEIERIENLATSYKKTSEIGQINALAGIDSVSASQDIINLIQQAESISRLSNGAFDITILPLKRLWNFKSANPVVPGGKEISRNLSLIDYEKIVTQENKVYLPLSEMGLDLGGIAKGYAVDRAADFLTEMGYEDFMVEAGGDLMAKAGPLTKGQRRIWVRHPRYPDRFFATIDLDAGAVATSGDYERSFKLNGKNYHHILNPKTGYPADNSVVSVTIIADNVTRADALATAVFVLGPQDGMELIEADPRLEGLIILTDGQDKNPKLSWKISKNLTDKINFIEDSN